MSADNGVYILEMKDQARVIHAQAIDNLNWTWLGGGQSREKFVPTAVVEYFGGVKPMTLQEAHDEAHRLYKDILDDDFGICEYGIQHFTINKTWDQIVREAKELAPKEILAIKGKRGYGYLVKQLQSIIDM